MLRSVRQSVRGKLMLVVIATTFIALLVAAAVMVAYDLRSYKEHWASDLETQADIIGLASAAALGFDDAKAATENLSALRVRPNVLAAAIYSNDGEVFASYLQTGAVDSFPAVGEQGYRIEGNRISVFHRIMQNGERIGTIYLHARYDMEGRLKDYVKILGVVMVGSMVVALLLSSWLQARVTDPVLAVADVAQKVMQRRDYSLRAYKTTDDEVGLLVEAFNSMLAEVEKRASELEASNLTLQQEMTERLAAEKALRLADRRKDEFLATLAHELRNPLAPMRNALEILRIAGERPEQAKLAREMLERQLRQMVRLVDDLLDVSRITTGKLAIKKEHAELRRIVENAVETANAMIAARNHKLHRQFPEQPLYMDADPTRLAQVVANLLNNAAKYTEPGGEIFLEVEAAGASEVLIKVRDTGIGIDNRMLPDIFDMFTQLDRSLERSQAGLGVGLSLSKRLVELHGGTIEARSPGLGQGSEFIVRLPVSHAASQSSPAAAATTHGSTAAFRILLADDNVDFAVSFATILRSLGHEVRVVNDGLSALELAAQFHPQFAFLDIGLPKLNGYELAARLRNTPATAKAVLVAVTGWGQSDDRKRAREAGFDHHIVKPAEPETVRAILSAGPR